MDNNNKNFNGFAVFMVIVTMSLFLSLKVSFVVSLICALVFAIVLRACWIVYGFIIRVIGGVDFGKLRKKEGKQKRTV